MPDSIILEVDASPQIDIGVDTIAKGDDGDSAYQVAVNNGYVGTEAQWLASLVGATGNGVASVTLLSSVEKANTYRMLFTDGTYVDYVVMDGEDGTGKLSQITFNSTVYSDDGTGNVSFGFTESDPVFVASDAYGISATDISNWDSKANGSHTHITSDITNFPSLATVATSGSYTDLSDKPTIPSEVTETTVSGWGFTKNTGTYSKPSGGIPKTDLASEVQTSLGKADTALQSYTETDPIFTASDAYGIDATDISNWNSKASGSHTHTTSDITNFPSLATVATSGSYEDLSNKPTIPSAVTETTVSGWGFTKNTGTYSKPSGGIPKTDLESAVQTSLGLADSALQSFTETDPTVPSWAKASSKPSYTKSEVGLGNVDNVQQYSASNPPPYPVTSVNGSTGAVTGLQTTSNLVTSVSSASTNSQYPSAKLFYDTVGNIESLLASI